MTAPRVTASEEASPELRKHMAAHFQAATALQAAIAQGRLSDARDQAHWFASHDMDAPPGWGPYIDELRYSAMRIERARDVPTAGVQIARLGRACSSCHEAQNAHPAFAYEAPPADDKTLEAQMARHQWAAERLWEGLVGPADQLWQEGARVMATARLDVAASMHDKPNAEVVELAERLQEQATEAVSITNRDARATWFGAIMETCANCHSITRPAAVVGVRQEE
ncbi:MAG TPA: hypothetical protein VIV40_04790 [Kofleriaceae bacterium]